MKTTFNPWKKEIAYLQTVNKAISMGYPLYVYRTIDSKVEKCEIVLMGIHLDTGILEVQYKVGTDELDFGKNWHQEDASTFDLKMISEQAQQYQKQALARRVK